LKYLVKNKSGGKAKEMEMWQKIVLGVGIAGVIAAVIYFVYTKFIAPPVPLAE